MKTKRSSFTRSLFCWITFLIMNRSTGCFGQDTTRHFPELKKSGNMYIYGDKRITEKEMQTQLVLLGNMEITKQIQLAKNSKGLQGVGYWAIPLGIFATYLGIAAQPFLWKPYEPEKERMSQLCYAATFLTITSSIYFKIDSHKKNAKALRFYKEYYGNQ